MARFALIVIIVLTSLFVPFSVGAQHRVKMGSGDIAKYSLPKSLDSTYMLYTFLEYKKLQLDLAKLRIAANKLLFMESKVKALMVEVEATKTKAETLQKDLNDCLKSRKRLTKKWSGCDLKYRMCQAGSWKPWAITAAAIVVGIVGASLGGYYGWKYSKVK